MSEAEDWYDREISPKLREICDACNARGMSVVAVVEYEPGSQATSYRLTEQAGLAMTMILHCARTAPNLDGYVIGLARHCREKGIDVDASMVMRKLAG